MKSLCAISAVLMFGLMPLYAGTLTGPAAVSRPNRASLSGTANSFTPSFSADRRLIVFVSQAKDLSTNGVPSPYLDLFARDVAAENTLLISASTNGVGGGDGDSSFATISTNGQLVAFESAAGNLTANDTNGFSDVFIRDLAAGTTRLLSISTNGVLGGDRPSTAPLISADGRRVVFESMASNLVSNDLNGGSNDVFVCELPSGMIRLVSVNNTGTGGPLGLSDSVSMSADGRYVAFRSLATNVVSGTSNQFGEIFVRDLDNGTTIWASSDAGGSFTNGLRYACFKPSISADGRYVIYMVAEANNPSSARFLRRYELASGLTMATTNSPGAGFFTEAAPIISPNGRHVAFETQTDGWILTDLDTGTFEPVGAPPLATSRAPVFAPDSSQIVFLGAGSSNGPWSVYLRNLGTREQSLVSVSTNETPAEVIAVSQPAISPDGTLVAFESVAPNLVTDDLNQAADIFLRDLEAGTTHLVSQRAPTVPAATSARGALIGPRSVSEYGRFIAFTSLDNQLADGDDNPWQDAFVRDMIAGTNQLLRLSGVNPAGPLRLAFSPVLSTNGRYAAWYEQRVPQFVTSATATNIFWLDRETGESAVIGFAGTTFGSAGPALSGDGRWLTFSARLPSSYTNIFLRDMFASNPSDQLISVNRFGTAPGNGDSTAPMLSPDRRWVIFQSRARDLTTNSVSGVGQIFARDLATGITRLVSSDSTGRNGLPNEASNPLFSGDSRYVFFQSRDLFSSSNILYRHDLKTTNVNLIVCAGCSNPSASAEGRFVAFLFSTVLGSYRDVYLRDLISGQTTPITTNILGGSGIGGNRSSFSPQVSFDGRYVVFASQASNLVPNDTNNFTDIFVHDRVQRTTMLVSRSLSGEPANSLSTLPVLAPDGRTFVFVSFASDLAQGDFNNTRDIYVLRLAGPDTDADGMGDDWEITYFSTLKRDGTGDFDDDGWSDLQEFRAGTDPTNSGSILRVLTIDSLNGTSKTILWSAQPGRTYRVQFKRDVIDPVWTDLPGTVTASDTTASKQDTSAASEPHRFYRVVLEP